MKKTFEKFTDFMIKKVGVDRFTLWVVVFMAAAFIGPFPVLKAFAKLIFAPVVIYDAYLIGFAKLSYMKRPKPDKPLTYEEFMAKKYPAKR